MECDVQASFPYLRGLTGNRMLSSCDRIDAKASISRTRDLLPSWRWLITLCVATMLSSEAPSVASQAVDQGTREPRLKLFYVTFFVLLITRTHSISSKDRTILKSAIHVLQ